MTWTQTIEVASSWVTPSDAYVLTDYWASDYVDGDYGTWTEEAITTTTWTQLG
jgi:hypothetical protein